MNEFLMDMHCHTKQVSCCAHATAEDLVRVYAEAGYSGVVITDHLNRDNYMKYMRPLKWKDAVDFYLSGYEAAKQAAGDKLTVLLGMELSFFDHWNFWNDYLVYGITKEILLECEGVMDWGIRKFSQFAHERGLLIYQAHPFRNSMRITNPELLDGIEVFNGNPHHDSRNDIAELWAEKFGLKRVGGSDFHELEYAAIGGIRTDKKICSNEMLLETLIKGDFTLVKP